MHRHCLRWMVGRYADTSRETYLSVNPHNPLMGSDNCPMYREDIRVMKKKGFTNMYYDMPGHLEFKIRRQLIAKFGRKQYFQMRKGEQLITPEDQQFIAQVCQKHGWTAPLIYDGEDEDWLW